MMYVFLLFPEFGREMVQKHHLKVIFEQHIGEFISNPSNFGPIDPSCGQAIAVARLINPNDLQPIDSATMGSSCGALQSARLRGDWFMFTAIATDLAILSADRITIDDKGVHLSFPLEYQQHPLPERMIV